MVGKAAVHIKSGPPACSTVHRFGKNTVNFARVWFCAVRGAVLYRQEHLVQAVCMGPDFARNKAIGAAQKLQVIVEKICGLP